ncbi:TlyA family RNA methyltransferase [Lentisphaera profundi]|uniref:TlyA family RNA methyltransferase n=1 Tax=Lentisphaera profundi TaxID=1658616 RepID=A0ABY7VUX7_9BACT|nr:TlyA family RNA methyltransferase [Lentisphaera profundi]WDE97088.1 TlyA family RNA methyltransferase [Lentisphaera profundi]
MPKIKKKRADQLLIEQGLVESTEEAKKLILLGLVRSRPDHIVRKTTETYPIDSEMSVDRPSPYVSRGAFKLKKSLRKFAPDLSNQVAMDVGASTGGFTDLMLQFGVKKVYTIDSGTNQLHYKIRSDERVVCRENFNAKNITDKEIPELVDLMTCDVSFISVTKILSAAASRLKSKALAFILVKPQFELRKDLVGDGVVRDEALRQQALSQVCTFCQDTLNWELLEQIDSPLAGPKGNVEFLAVFQAP